MKLFFILLLPLLLSSKSFTGIINKNIKNNGFGIWIIKEKKIQITEIIEFDERYGKIKEGTCVKVNISDGEAEEMMSLPISRCK